ncbi:unnamed protein product, partial [Tuber aestivum]
MQVNEYRGPKHPKANAPHPLLRLVPSVKRPRFILFLLLLVSTPLGATAKTNFTKCGARVKELAGKNTLPFEDIYAGPVKGPLGQGKNTEYQALLITFGACEKHCGSTPDFYSWQKASDTITTWVLPLASLVLQAPFWNNDFKKNILVLFRWVGSPIASMMYIFWNMKVTRKCAILVDMSVQINDRPGPESSFAKLRDSLYLLSVINQYELCPQLEEHRMEEILRTALFDGRPKIQEAREGVTTSIRRERRRGAVQVLASLAWFLVALAISIHKAFGDLGENSTAHNLALGLLVCWLPVLVAATIVDRNPMDAGYVRDKLHALVLATMEEPEIHRVFGGAKSNFFGKFAGQGRVRWHSGAAYSILRTLETMPNIGRGWLSRTENVNRLTASTYSPLMRFDRSQGWQMAAAFTMVFSCSMGAFIVSYFTPTVGLGCRSGGYMIFGLNASGCLLLELAAWAVLHSRTKRRVVGWFLCFWEFINSCLLVCIIIAQTFGIYNNCYCKSSMLGGAGGYMDFESVQYYKSYNVEISWFLGTLITCVFSG